MCGSLGAASGISNLFNSSLSLLFNSSLHLYFDRSVLKKEACSHITVLTPILCRDVYTTHPTPPIICPFLSISQTWNILGHFTTCLTCCITFGFIFVLTKGTSDLDQKVGWVQYFDHAIWYQLHNMKLANQSAWFYPFFFEHFIRITGQWRQSAACVKQVEYSRCSCKSMELLLILFDLANLAYSGASSLHQLDMTVTGLELFPLSWKQWNTIQVKNLWLVTSLPFLPEDAALLSSAVPECGSIG